MTPSAPQESLRPTDERVLKIYEELCHNIRVSDDISFKLMGLVPLISASGAAILLLSDLIPKDNDAPTFIAIVAAGITFGLFKWELRNVQKCSWLIRCAADIENIWFGDGKSSGQNAKVRQFNGWTGLLEPPLLGPIPPFESPTNDTRKRKWFRIGKTEAERIVYWVSIMAWFGPIIGRYLS